MGKRVTSKDVANAAGVSRTTVSLVLNNHPTVIIPEATRQRVREVAAQLNYHPNAQGRKLVSGKSLTIGLILHQTREEMYADAMFLQFLLGLEDSVAPYGFNVLTTSIDPAEKPDYTKLIDEGLVDGIVVSGPRQDDEELVAYHEKGFPIVLMGQLPGCHIPLADVDAVTSASIAADHLISLGHKRFGVITNAPLGYTSAEQRLQGFGDAVKNAGLSLEKHHIKSGSYTPESGYFAMKDILAEGNPPSALFIASDVVASGAYKAILEANLCIPEDISIVGFDDIPSAAWFHPPLTTLRLPAFDIARNAGSILINLITSTPGEEKILLPAELIERRSTIQFNAEREEGNKGKNKKSVLNQNFLKE